MNEESMDFENLQEKISLSLLNQTIENYYKDKLNKKEEKDDNINIENQNYLKITKINNSFESLYYRGKGKIKFNIFTKKIFHLIKKNTNDNRINMRNNKNIEKGEIINKAIVRISIIILKDYFNNRMHKQIQEYIKILFLFISNNILKIESFILILDILLNAILNILNNINNNQIYKYFKIKNEPLIFINDIIEGIIFYSFYIIDDSKIYEKMISIFNNFLLLAKKKNILIEKGIEWLKLLESKEININLKSIEIKKENNILNNINDFLINIYKKHIPINFYNEIYKKSVIDLEFYLNILKFLQKLYEKEEQILNCEGIKIKNGIYLLGNKKFYKNININSNQFSLIFSFKAYEIQKKKDITILKFFIITQGKKNIFDILINKEQNLVININKDSLWNSNIIIKSNKFYLICIVFEKSNKNLNIYINEEKTSNNDIIKEKLSSCNFCYKYTSSKIQFPNFCEKMNAQIGDDNFFGIIGEILLINKNIDTNSIEHLFNSNEYYANLINKNKIKYNLVFNKILFTTKCKDAIDHFKKLKYDCLLRIMPKSLYPKNKFNNKNELFEYKIIHSIQQFIKEKGIEFLIFMLHVIDCRINDHLVFNLYIYKTLEFFCYAILIYIKKETHFLYIEIDKEELIKQINIFFLTLLNILKSKEKNIENNNDNYLSKDVRNALINCLKIKFKNHDNIHINIITSILFDNKLFNQKEYILELNELIIEKIDISIVNEEIIYNILLNDSIFLLKNVKHKKYFKFLESLLTSNYKKLYCKELVSYIIKIKNEVKIYHYLKLIYYNLSKFKEILGKEDKNNIFIFLEKKFKNINHEHCKYCSYIMILCYLIKDEILIEGEKKNAEFKLYHYGHISSPSFLFIRGIFIQIFNLENIQKFQFIKTKNKHIYNMDYFDLSLKRNPFEFIDMNKFITRFTDIIYYNNYLMNIKKTKNIINLIENFFPFIIEFIDKVINIKTTNERKDIINLILKLLEYKENNNFFILFLKFNEEKALKAIKKFIKSYLQYFFKPILYLISPKTEIGNKKKSDRIKIEIIKSIIIEVVNIKKEKKNNLNENSLLNFLILIYKNVYENNIEIPIEFPQHFLNYYSLILEQKIFLDRRAIDVNYNKTNIELINEININNIKFISEIIIDIIVKFFFNDKLDKNKMLDIILIKSNHSSSIFFINDIENIKNIKKKSPKESNSSIFVKNMNNILFTLYYLIIFFNKFNLYKNEGKEKRKIILEILEILFNDLKKIYTETKKITSILKKVENNGINFEIYNKILLFCNKNYKEYKFDLNYFYKKYNSLNKMDINLKNKNSNIVIEGLDQIDDNNNDIDKKENKNVRSNSFNKLISNSMKEKLIKKLDESIITSIFNFENNLNQSMIIDIPININDMNDNNDMKEMNDGINNIPNKNNQEIEIEGEKYIRAKLSNFNQDFYNEKIINCLCSDDIKMIINPKEFFLWKNFTIAFKDLIYNNKKFKKISKAFKISTRNTDVVFSSKKDKEFFLNYPSKLKNYVIDDYYRPFLKPCLNFFKTKYLRVTHSYIDQNILINNQYKEDNFNLIQFKRIIPNLSNKQKIIKCERVQNKGSIFGYIKFNKDYMLFVNSPSSDERKSKDLKIYLKYLYSLKEDSIIDRNKYTIIFYKDIKEIFKRRFCLNFVGYEIFMKDNHSYSFNFFNMQNASSFLEYINKLTQAKRNKQKNEEDKMKNDKNKINNISKNDNNLYENEYDFKIIEEPISSFKKMEFKKKFKKGEISNFNYLLIMNKYGSRSYNDNGQYLIFPLLFIDESRIVKRDLSKAICLNKGDDFERIKNNKKYLGYYFTQHYSTSGFIFFYLVRLIPFTYGHIDLQSGKFDLPSRIFNSMKCFLMFLNLLQENRELIPEFFCNYEFFINLNYNNLGMFKNENECYFLNNFDVGKRDETYVEFVIYMRNLLEKSDISPWIDDIFGVYQLSNTDDHPNSYPLYTYESLCNFEKIKNQNISLKEKIEQIEQKISLLKLGITPSKLFNKNHPKNNKQKNNEFDEESLNNFEKKKQKIIESINNYIKKRINEREKEGFYLINKNNTEEIELIIKFDSKIEIIKMKLGEIKYSETSILTKGEIQMSPYSNLFCEISDGLYCIVRNINESIKFISQKKLIEVFQWTCIITAIAPFIQKKKIEEKNIKKIILGDEKGYLHLMKIELSQNEKIHDIISIKIIKSIKAQNSLIKGIIYNEKLNIIVSWSDEGVISINNDYTFTFLNIIDLGNFHDIKELIISKYDLLYVYCYDFKNKLYKIICYTLNGIKATAYETQNKIVKFFVEEEKIIIVQENKNIFIYNSYDLYKIRDSIFCDYLDNYGGIDIHIQYCNYFPKIKKMLILFSDNKIDFKNI